MRQHSIYLSTVFILIFISGLNSILAQDKIVDWTFQEGNSYHSSPVSSDTTIYIGGMDGYFYAIDSRSGVERWKFNSFQAILSTGLLHHNMVLFVSGGKIFALDKRDGTELWSYCSAEQSSKAQLDDWDYHHSSPYLSDDVVYFGDDWGNLNGLNVNSGELVFRYTTENGKAIRSTPVIHEGVIFFGDWRGIIYAVQSSDSSLVWSFTPYESLPYEGFGNTDSRLVVHKDALYFGSRNPEFYCLDIKDGTKKWIISDSGGSWMTGSPVINNDTLYFGGSDNKTFFSIELLSGEVIWKHKTEVNIFTTPLLFENYICFGTVNSYNHQTGQGSLRIISKVDGKLINRYNPGSNILSSPIKVDEKIVFGTSNGEVLALNADILSDKP